MASVLVVTVATHAKRLCCPPDMCSYDTIEEFNVDLKAECDQLNLAHVTRIIRKRRNYRKINNTSANLVWYI